MAAEPLRLALRPAARRDLEEIFAYTARTWSPAQADRYLRGLHRVMETLQEFPELAPERRAFDPPVRLHPCQRHLIVYRAEADTLEILRILHTRQNWRALLAEP